MGRHGGGAFTQGSADEGGSLGLLHGRYIAKNLVPSGLASGSEVQLAYAIRRHAEPVSVMVNHVPARQESKMPGSTDLVRREFQLTRADYRPRCKLRSSDLIEDGQRSATSAK